MLRPNGIIISVVRAPDEAPAQMRNRPANLHSQFRVKTVCKGQEESKAGDRFRTSAPGLEADPQHLCASLPVDLPHDLHPLIQDRQDRVFLLRRQAGRDKIYIQRLIAPD